MYNILVTGVGAIIGYGIVRTLKKSPLPLRVMGVDIYSHAVGQYWCDGFQPICRTDDPAYADTLKHQIDKWSIDLVIPAIEQDVSYLSHHRDRFNTDKVRLALNQQNIITLSQDKWDTFEFLEKNNFLTIPTTLVDNYDELVSKFGSPFLLKPRRSYAGKGIEAIYSREEFNFYRPRIGNNYMAQKMIGTDDGEYTASLFGYGDGTSSIKCIMNRHLHPTGATERATVIEDKRIEEHMDQLCKILKPIGPTNFQYRYHENELYLLEINPRFSSSNSIRAAFGFNEPMMAVQFFLENKKAEIEKLQKGAAIRYLEDFIVFDGKKEGEKC